MVTTIAKEKMTFGSNLRAKEAKVNGVITLEMLHDTIRTDRELQQLTHMLRSIKGEKQYRQEKLKLPFIMPHGVFSERRKSGLKKRSKVFCVDIDKIDNPETIKKELSLLPFVTLIFTSPSGKGIKVFLVIDPEQGNHLAYFTAFSNYFKSKHGIEIDQACKDISRACLVCYDPNPYFNPDAKMLGNEFVEKWGNTASKATEEVSTASNLKDIKFEVATVDISKEEQLQIGSRSLAQAINKVLNANDGKKHMVLRNQACFLGYCTKYGMVELTKAYDVLYGAISKRKVSSLSDAKKTIVSGLHYGVNNTPAFEDLKLIDAPEMYFIGKDEEGNFFYHIYYTKLYRFLNYHGFWVYQKAGVRIFVQVEDNVITKVNKHDVISFVLQHIRSLPWKLAEGITRENLEEYFRKKMNVFFSENQLSTLDFYFPKFNVDDAQTAYLYFTNGFLKVTKDSIELLPYSQLDGVIWDTQILDREFNHLQLEQSDLEQQGEFTRFLLGVSNNREGDNQQRYNSLVSIIGYLLHRYKNPSFSRAIIFCDENISQNPSGGSGKGIVLKALGKFRNTALIDGKNFNFKSQFAFQQVGLDTEMIVFEDVNLGFDFEKLFSVITEGLSVEKKGQDRFFIPFEETPKIVITTNYMIAGSGNSHNRRKVEYEFSKFYNESHTPNSEFGHNLYDDWNQRQWELFDNFMISCVQYFLQKGIIDPPQINIAKRKLLQETGEEFVHFVEEKMDFYVGQEVSKSMLSVVFLREFPEFERKPWFTQRLYNRWLRTYAEVFGLQCSERVSNNNQLILFQKK